MSIPYFSAAEIYDTIGVLDLLEPLVAAMIEVSKGNASLPPRFTTPINESGRMGVMFGGISKPAVHGVKILSLYPNAPAMGLSSRQDLIILFDSVGGQPKVVLDADIATAMRTAAMSMIATQTLARPDPSIITICGAGEQAEWHVRGSLACFESAQIRIWARRAEQAQALRSRFPDAVGKIQVVEDLKGAVSGADVIHTTTASRDPFLPGAFLEPGQHINLVGGSLMDSREIDDEAVAMSSMFTSSREASNRESGEYLGALKAKRITNSYPVIELGAVLDRAELGRQSETEITLYKSLGSFFQDLILAQLMLQKAQNDCPQ